MPNVPGRKILIVDDDEGFREGIRDLLEDQGYHVDTCVNGLEALAHLHAQSEIDDLPALILLDLVMPVDGWKFREEQLRDPKLARVPVVIVSGVYQPEPAAKTLEAAAHLSKPVDSMELLSVVRRLSG